MDMQFLYFLLSLALMSVSVRTEEPVVTVADICQNNDTNGHFDSAWCNKLTTTEGCRLGIVNLLFAASEGDTESLKKYFTSGMDMSLADYDKRAALHLSAAEGHLEATKFLVEVAKVPPTPKDRWGYVPLDEAMRFERSDVIQYLTNLPSNSTPTAAPILTGNEKSVGSSEEALLNF